MDNYIEIPPDKLGEPLLQAVIEEFVMREGTDYGQTEYTLAEKVQRVKMQLDSGAVFIAYDQGSESCTLIVRE